MTSLLLTGCSVLSPFYYSALSQFTSELLHLFCFLPSCIWWMPPKGVKRTFAAHPIPLHPHRTPNNRQLSLKPTISFYTKNSMTWRSFYCRESNRKEALKTARSEDPPKKVQPIPPKKEKEIIIIMSAVKISLSYSFPQCIVGDQPHTVTFDCWSPWKQHIKSQFITWS